jgi:homoserine O-acetyltransferase
MKQKEDSDDTLFADKVCRYQHHQGDKLVARFDAYSYWYLSYSVDSSNVGRGRGGIEKALAQIKADSIVVSIDTDLIFPPYGMEEWAPMIPGAKYYKITSHFGHDGFLLETEQLTNLLEPILKKL